MGRDLPTLEHLGKLRYLEQILMESLRLWPTAPAFGVKPIEDTVLAGRYPLTTKDTVLVLEPMLHRDPAVWGDDAESFRPERFAQEEAEKLPPNAWKPFGNGMRACIGRSFAMQEAQLVLAMLLQRFDIVLDDPGYRLQVAETLTMKPQGLMVRARLRGQGSFALQRGPIATPAQKLTASPAADTVAAADAAPLLVLWGSNTGSCEMFARRIGSDAARQGYKATIGPLDQHVDGLRAGVPAVVVTASYEGQAPDNAKQFVAWLEGLPADALAGVPFAVFGCGNRQWARTYQAVPKRVDAALAAAGATRLRARGEADAGGDFFGAFDAWYQDLWGELDQALGREPVERADAAPTLAIELVRAGRETALQLGELELGTIAENRELVELAAPNARSKRHLQIALPAGMSYACGDYLAVLPRNPPANVERALRRFALASDSQIMVHKQPGAPSAIPSGYPIAAFDVLSGYVELAQPATRSQLIELAQAARCPPECVELERLGSQEVYEHEILERRVSVLDLLERMQSCDVPLARFLAMLPMMRARQYSISSSPLADPSQASLTVAVVDAPALAGHGQYLGVASSHLAQLQAGDRVSVAVRPSQSGFHPPADPAVPMVLVCAGTGLAPFRGFLQERALQQAAGRTVGKSLLFFGIDDADVDYLYRDQFAQWERQGVVEVRLACSMKPLADGIRFVQHRVWQDRAEVQALFEAGAQFFVCGDGKHMAPAVRDTFIRIYREASAADQATAQQWADQMEHEHGRYVSDVFA